MRNLKTFLYNLLQNYSFRQKLMFTYIMLIIFPFVIFTWYLAVSTVKNVESNMKSLGAQIHKRELTYVNSVFATAKYTSKDIIMNPTILNYFMQPKTNTTDQIAMYNRLTTELGQMELEGTIRRIRLFVDDGYVFAGEKVHFFPLSEALQHGWVSKDHSKPHTFWTTDKFIDYKAMYRSREMETISYVSYLPNLDKFDKTVGVISVDILKDDIAGTLKEFSTNDIKTYIIDNKNNFICYTDEVAPKNSIVTKNPSDDVWYEQEFLGGRAFVISSPILYTDWSIVTVLPRDSIAKSGYGQLTALLILAFIITIIVVFIAVLASRLNSKRIKKLTEYASRIQRGYIIPTNENYGSDEIGQLCDAFNSTISRISELIKVQRDSYEQIKDAELKIMKSELEVLQTQIDPHFLYNTLSMINWTAAKYGCTEVEQQILLLSDYYKSCLSSGETMISIADEAQIISTYIKLQNMRSESFINFECSIDAIAHYKIPKLTLQPLVENSILHGILKKSSKAGTIRLKGECADEYILLYVLDDGTGIDAAVQRSLPETKRKSYGIENVSTRLKLHFGEECGLTFSANQPCGTKVTIKIKK